MAEVIEQIPVVAEQLHAPAVAALAGRARRLAKRLVQQDGFVRWGSLRRTRPLSDNYGFDRGLPVDRAYIERFIEEHSADIRGRVLEVADRTYTLSYGGERITSSDVVDIDESNEDATIVADLCRVGSLPAERFECVLATQTLQYVDRPVTALENIREALVPGGVALITVPTASRIDWELSETDFWRLTPHGLRRLIEQSGPWGEVDVRGHGNVLAVVAFLMGISADELRADELADEDDQFPLVACARARKAG